MERQLRDLLKHGRKFERLHTDVPGIFVRKIPQTKGEPPYLAVEINPVDERGYPVHNIGVVIRNQQELKDLRAALSSDNVDEVLRAIHLVETE